MFRFAAYDFCMLVVTITVWSQISTPVWSHENQALQTFTATDSLAPGEESIADARECLDGLLWKPTTFEVTLKPNLHPLDPAIVRFPSPRPSGIPVNDLVALEWYSAKNEKDEVIDAPAIVVVHESGSRMEVGRLIAKALHAQGLHAFLIHLPTYGLRRGDQAKPPAELVDAVMRQGIVDARRARDAVAVLPHVDARSISIQGTSLGGFVTATAAGLDRGFSTVHIMVAGGNLYELVINGNREAGRMREDLAQAGFTGDKLKQLFASIEPIRLAHRYDRKNTWLYTANRDQVVPPQHATALRKAAGLDEDHEMILLADHYSGIIYVPIIVADIAKKIRTELAIRYQMPE
jgi:dienelactone hydrolase